MFPDEVKHRLIFAGVSGDNDHRIFVREHEDKLAVHPIGLESVMPAAPYLKTVPLVKVAVALLRLDVGVLQDFS